MTSEIHVEEYEHVSVMDEVEFHAENKIEYDGQTLRAVWIGDKETKTFVVVELSVIDGVATAPSGSVVIQSSEDQVTALVPTENYE